MAQKIDQDLGLQLTEQSRLVDEEQQQQFGASRMALRRSSCEIAKSGARLLHNVITSQNLNLARRSSWSVAANDRRQSEAEEELRRLLLASALKSANKRRRSLLIDDKYLIRNRQDICVLEEADEAEQHDEPENIKMDLSFSGAGFMGCYYFGVVNCWNKYIPRERVRRVAGASAGSLIAAYYLLDLPMDSCLYEIVSLLDGIRKRPLGVFDRKHQIVDMLPALLDKLFPDDAHKRVNGRLFVSMTRLRDMKNIIVNQFNTKKELIDALNCSSFIPVWSGNHVSTFRGVKHIDGGFTNNLPVFDEHTVRICCFSGTSDIAPTDKARLELLRGNLQGMPFYVNWANVRRMGRALWPPPATYVIGLIERGFHDTKDFILTNDLIQCEKCYRLTAPDEQPIFCKLTPTISPAISRATSFADLSKLGTDEECALPPAPTCDHDGANGRLTKSKSTPRLRLKLPGSGGKRMASPDSDKGSSESSDDQEDSAGRQSGGNKQRLISASSLDAFERTESETSSFKSQLGDRLKRLAHSQRSSGGSKSPESPLVPPTIVIEPPVDQTDSGVDEANDSTESGTGEQARHQVRSKLIILPPGKQPDASESASSTSSGDDDDDDNDANQSGESSGASPKQKKKKRGLFSRKSKAEKEERIKLGKLCNRRQSLATVATGSPSEKFIAGCRRNTQAQLDTTQIFLLADKFSRVAEPLPSCPPSPNLNRLCSECIRLRQDARMDAVDEAIMEQVEKYSSPKARELEMKQAGVKKSKITSPIRWFKQRIGTKSYAFDEENRSQAIAQTVAY